MKTRFIIIYKYAACYMHGIYKDKPLPDTGFGQAFFNLGSDIDKGSAGVCLEKKFFAI